MWPYIDDIYNYANICGLGDINANAVVFFRVTFGRPLLHAVYFTDEHLVDLEVTISLAGDVRMFSLFWRDATVVSADDEISMHEAASVTF